MSEVHELVQNEQPKAAESRATPEPVPAWDLNASELYLNRELTWLSFNARVLHEAEDVRTPLLERVKFLAIVGANLDEFFMKRIGGLKQQAAAGMAKLTVDGRTPQQQIAECYQVVRAMEDRKHATLEAVLAALAGHGIRLVKYEEIEEQRRGGVREYYFRNIFPLVTPQSIDPAHPFPFISNLSLNLLVTVRDPGKNGKISLTRIKVPVGPDIPRFLRVGDSGDFVRLEDVMANNLDMLLPGVEVLSCEKFRVTRNANTERAEDHAEDLVSMIESELRDRRFAPIVRMEIETGMDPVHKGMLAAELGLDEQDDVFEVDACLATRDLFEIAGLKIPELHDMPHEPIDHAELRDSRSIFYIIRDDGPLLLQHPYESFANSVERFLKEASEDPKVRAIKMTLYRTSGESKVVEYLIRAARNGKQVAVVVELKARFDEAANLHWASRMEEAGIHVTYGVVGLKTHSKITLVVRRDYTGIQRYMHIGTGNYHAGTARLYADLSLLTNDDALGQDATELFNYLTTGYTPERKYAKLLPSPRVLKRALLKKIQREREWAKKGERALIQLKMNALEDVDITRALYEASREGVQVDLIVRDTCRFRPGVPGLSETARVISIVGRFLEHTRVYYFRNGGEEEYFIGSADCMQRNLESRVEVVTPVEAPKLREQLRTQLDAQLSDYRGAWEMQSDGNYVQRQPRSEAEREHSQEKLIRLATERLQKASRQEKRRRKPLGGRNLR